MKNKFLIGIITFFSTIIFTIIIFNYSNSDTIKAYTFNRKFVNTKILNFEEKYSKMNENEYIMYLNSDENIVERDKKIVDENTIEYKLYFSDLSFKNKKTINVLLPKKWNIILADRGQLFYTLKFKLFKYNIETKESQEIGLDNFKAFSLKSLPNSKTKFLCFGEFFNNNIYKTGFYIIDMNNAKIVSSKILQTTTSTSMPKNSLAYSGNFTTSFDKSKMAYSCDKYSEIYLFDNNGFYLNDIKTNENAPLPEILKNGQGCSFYSRGATWITNMGIFFNKDKVYVFSASTNDFMPIVIDEYSLTTLKYIQSYKLNYNNLNSKGIRNVFIDKNRIVVGFEFYYASFTFSRYI